GERSRWVGVAERGGRGGGGGAPGRGVYVGQGAPGPYPSVSAQWFAGQQWIVAVMYLPCLAVVLTRRNEWTPELRLLRRADDRRRIDAEFLVVRELDRSAAAQHREEADAGAHGVLG